MLCLECTVDAHFKSAESSAQFKCPSTSGELRQQHYDATALQLHTWKDADPELGNSLRFLSEMVRGTCFECVCLSFNNV